MKLKLVNKKIEAENIISFFFKPKRKINYLPGQYLYYSLPELKYPDIRGNTRQFTISSSPTEKFIRLTTLIRPESGFKKTLAEMRLGEFIEGDGPHGVFYFSGNETGNYVFIAGGVGVTPFRSIIKFMIDKKQRLLKLNLIYIVTDIKSAAFVQEFNTLAKTENNFKFEVVETGNHKNKNAKQRQLNINLLQEMCNKWNIDKENGIFWICGPREMVNNTEANLISMKIPAGKIVYEKFTGY